MENVYIIMQIKNKSQIVLENVGNRTFSFAVISRL